jgi:MATE family multidrug resistance protein
MNETRSQNHTSTGGIKELSKLFFPILLMTFSQGIFLLVEKLLLGRLSTQAMEAAVNVAFVSQIFQGATVALAMMAQVFVGTWYGSKQLTSIGPGIWQFIWFAFLSMFISIPGSLVLGKWYFQGTCVETVALPYFYLTISIQFLFPLGTTLSCFFVGQGKTRLVLWTTLGSQFVKLGLAYILIFGYNDWLPSFGIMGGVISTAIAQGSFCIVLLSIFLSKKYAQIYQSRNFRFQFRLFWDCIYVGFLRALNRILNFTSWMAIAHLMSAKGGLHLLVLSIGGAINLFLPFVGDALCQAQTTIVSQILGAKQYSLLNKAFRSGLILTCIIIGLISIPLLIFPCTTFHFLFPHIVMSEINIQLVLLGIWISFVFFTIAYLPISYILAFKDTKFSLFMGVISWINGFLLMYVFIEMVRIEANQFWIALSVMHATTAFFYLWRRKNLQKRLKPTSLLPSW